MFKGMAIRTQNHQVFSRIIGSVFVNMMNSKDFLFSVISTRFTFFKHSSSDHSFSDRSIYGFKRFLFFVSCTLRAAKFRGFARRIPKYFMAIDTCKLDATPSYLRLVVAFTRTIFSSITSARYMFKSSSTHDAICAYFLRTSEFVFAFPRTIFKRSQSIYGHVAFFATSRTVQKFSSARFHNATP